jgi:Ca2+-binding RTX toxin-like protein
MSINLDNIFFEDYYGVKWETTPTSTRTITWSGENDSLRVATGGVKDATARLEPYMDDLRKAFSVWDNSIDNIKFVETNTGNSADITVSITDFDSDLLDGYWSSTWDGNKYITKSTIQLRYGLSDELLLATAMHEIGNVLGLGDVEPNSRYQSVQEDPFPEYFNGNELWSYDKQLIDSIYPSFAEEPIATPTPVAPTPTPTPEPIPVAPAPEKPQIEDEIITFNKIKGSRKNDRLNGTNGADQILGKGGNDIINGKNGDDLIDPGKWTTGKFDKIKGGKGSDTFVIKDGYWAFMTDFKVFEDKLDISGLSQGMDWEINGRKTYIYGDDGYEVARFKGKVDLSGANII